MANKTIPDLTLISAVVPELSVPGDDSITTYRFTIAQLKTYLESALSINYTNMAADSVRTAALKDLNVTLAKLELAIFSGLTAVTPVAADYVSLVDASDSDKTKKAKVSLLRNAVYRSVSTTDAVGVDDETMKMSGASFTSTLPTAVGVEGKRYKYIHAGTSLTQVYTLATTSSQTIGGIASAAYKLCTNGEILEIESDGANWIIVNHVARTGWTNIGAVTIGATTTAPTKPPAGVVNDEMLWMRDGADAIIRYTYRQTSATSAAAGSGDYKIPNPANIVTDTTKLTAYATVGGFQHSNCVGNGGAGTNTYAGACYVVVFDSGFVRCTLANTAASGWWSSSLGPLTTTVVSVSIIYRIPVVDWQP